MTPRGCYWSVKQDHQFLTKISTLETRVQSQVKLYQKLKKWYLIPPCLTLSIIRYGSRVKWSILGKRVVPSPTSWSSGYSKRSLLVALDSSCQLYFTTIIYIYIYIYIHIYLIFSASAMNVFIQAFHNESIFKWSTTCLNSGFSFSLTGCPT